MKGRAPLSDDATAHVSRLSFDYMLWPHGGLSELGRTRGLAIDPRCSLDGHLKNDYVEIASFY